MTDIELLRKNGAKRIHIEGIGLINYLATKDGRIYSIKRKKFLKQSNINTVCISHNGIALSYTVSKLIALTFVNNPNPKVYTIVGHINGDMYNNDADNLFWGTDFIISHYAKIYNKCDNKLKTSVINDIVSGMDIEEMAKKYDIQLSELCKVYDNHREKRRIKKGSRNKLTESDKTVIKEAFLKRPATVDEFAKEMAKKYNVSDSTILRAVYY